MSQTLPSLDIKDSTIAIIGGGVCGLVCAIALAREGIPSHVYEAASKFGELGAGIGIGPNAAPILRALGLWDDILAKVNGGLDTRRTNRMGGLQTRFGDARNEVIHDYPHAPGEESVGLHRAVFLDVLVAHLDPKFVHCHMNKRCTEVSKSDTLHGKAVISFADGTKESADIVIGADGIKIVVRGAVTGHDPMDDIRFSGSICYRGLVPIKDIEAAGVQMDLTTRPICFVGKSKHIVTYIIKGQFINTVAFVTDRTTDFRALEDASSASQSERDRAAQPAEPVSQEELLAAFDGWSPDVLALLPCVPTPTKWSINVLYPPLQSYSNGNIALIGDAAHAMVPHLGAGAGQGIEDGSLLANLLSHASTNLQNVAEVLREYDFARRPRASRVWDASLHAGDIYELLVDGGDTAHDVRKRMEGLADFVWKHDLQADIDAAIERSHQ